MVDIDPRPSRSSFPLGLVAFQNEVVFSASNANPGREVWRTDGTAAGTVSILSGANPIALGQGGSQLFVSADDGVLGTELWVVDPGTCSIEVGASCGDGLRMPRLLPVDPVLGGILPIRGSDAPTGTFGTVLLGAQAAPLPLPLVDGCDWYLGTSFRVALPGFGILQPDWQISLNVPNSPNLLDLRFSMQTFFGPVANPLGLEATNGLHIRLGN